ncbi:phosphoprotein [Chaco virus]|uniref:Phosphoprotein n=1 Tax=Chaco virus TaxID=1158189 RepID=A0A0D3R1M6_9RHAB|nr:phosphoprotein [Chaco virus]AJR28412.1 phosphoprotein [Chaco virus]
MENFPSDFDPTKNLKASLESFEKSCQEESKYGGETHNDLEPSFLRADSPDELGVTGKTDVFYVSTIPVGLSSKEIHDLQITNILNGFKQIGIDCKYLSTSNGNIKFMVEWADSDSDSEDETETDTKKEDPTAPEESDDEYNFEDVTLSTTTYQFLQNLSNEIEKESEITDLQDYNPRPERFLQDLKQGFNLPSIEGGHVHICLDDLTLDVSKIRHLNFPEEYDVREYCFLMLSKYSDDMELFSMVDWD